jgi:hypothetical protein
MATIADSLQPQAEADISAAPPVGEKTAPALAGPFFERTDWLAFSITAALLLVVYLCTLAPDVTLQESGTLATGAAYAGVPDTVGLPVWTIYSWLFTRMLPFSTIAWRVAVGSAVAASLASGMVALMVSSGGKLLFENSPDFTRRNPSEKNQMRVVCGCAAGVALGLSGPVWQKAVIVDFWTLGVLMFAVLLCLLMQWSAAPEKKRHLYGAFLIFGMMLTGNWELLVATPALLAVVMLGSPKLGRDLVLAVLAVTGIWWLMGEPRQLPPVLPWFSCFYRDSNLKALFYPAYLPVAIAALVLIIMTRRAGSEWRPAASCIFWLFLGLACWFYLPIASMMNPPINWAYPRTVAGFFHCISRWQYEQVHPTDNLRRFISQLWMVLKDTGAGLGWVYLPLSILPFYFLHRAHPSARRWMLGLAVMFLYVGPLMIAMLNPSTDGESLESLQPYWSASYVVLAVCAGLGMIMLAALVTRRSLPP